MGTSGFGTGVACNARSWSRRGGWDRWAWDYSAVMARPAAARAEPGWHPLGLNGAVLLGLLSFGLAFDAGSVARAGTESVATSAERAQKHAREKAAQDAFLAHRYHEALDLMNALYADFRDPVELRNIARCHQMLRDPAPAIANFKEYLARAPDLSREEMQEIQGYIRDMEALESSQAAGGAAEGRSASVVATPAIDRNPDSQAQSPVPRPAAAAVEAPSSSPPGPSSGGQAFSPAVSGAVQASSTSSTAATDRSSGSASRSNNLLIIGAVSGAVGLAGIVLGAVYGLSAQSKNDDSKSHCTGNVCDQTGKDLRDSALSRAGISTVSFIAGGALLAAGLVLVLRAPSTPSETAATASTHERPSIEGLTAELGGERASLLLRGRF